MADTVSVLIAGVGGQGVLLLSRVIAAVACDQFPEVARTEARGLSQRGGAVHASVRFGQRPCTPLTFTGDENFILSLELIEACRLTGNLDPNGIVIANKFLVPPAHMSGNGGLTELDFKRREIEIHFASANKWLLNLNEIAVAVQCPKAVNAVLLGAASNVLPFDPEQLRAELVGQVAKEHGDGNRRAFDAGHAEFGLLVQRHRSSVASMLEFDRGLAVVA